MARDVVKSYERRARERAVRVELTITPGLPDAEVDPHRLHQVLANLVSNALNQMPKGGDLGVRVDAVADWVVVEISDTGPGIPEDQLERIFERFVRAGDSSGTGLGLSISLDLVIAHGGTLTASNRTEGGAVFTVRLPGPPGEG